MVLKHRNPYFEDNSLPVKHLPPPRIPSPPSPTPQSVPVPSPPASPPGRRNRRQKTGQPVPEPQPELSRVDSPNPEIEFPKRKLPPARREKQKVPPPADDEDFQNKLNLKKDKISAVTSVAQPAAVPKRKVTRKEKPQLPEIRVPSPDFDLDFPKRKAPVTKTEIKSATYKRTIFKSRTKPILESPSIPEIIEKSKTSAMLEPPRVPPISEHFVEIPMVNSRSKSPSNAGANIRKILDLDEEVLPARTSKRKKPENKDLVVEDDNRIETSIPDDLSSRDLKFCPETQPPPSLEAMYSLNPPGDEDELDFPARLPLKSASQPKPIAGAGGKKTFFKSKSSKAAGKALSLYRHNVGWAGDAKKPDNSKFPETKLESLDFEEDEDEERYFLFKVNYINTF